MDEAIAMLNSPVRRKDSGDSINLRDTGFDPEHGGIHRRGDSGSLIHPVAVGDSFGYSGEAGGDNTQNLTNFMDEEEKEAEEQRRIEEEKKKSNHSPRRDIYRDKDGNIFDPSKKFGIIQDNSLIYGNVTSSYPLNLPTDYYQKYIVSNLPTKDAQ
jgi:hypothetical protein